MTKPLEQMTVDGLTEEVQIGSAYGGQAAHDRVMGCWDELARRNKLLVDALAWAKHELRAQGKSAQTVVTAIKQSEGEP